MPARELAWLAVEEGWVLLFDCKTLSGMHTTGSWLVQYIIEKHSRTGCATGTWDNTNKPQPYSYCRGTILHNLPTLCWALTKNQHLMGLGEASLLPSAVEHIHTFRCLALVSEPTRLISRSHDINATSYLHGKKSPEENISTSQLLKYFPTHQNQ